MECTAHSVWILAIFYFAACIAVLSAVFLSVFAFIAAFTDASED
jgi:hypothetical protein